MTSHVADTRFKTAKPSIYLDEWVWIRLAKANTGHPDVPSDTALLESLRAAAADGIAFPLSATHYEETSRIHDPAQRKEIARVMAPISLGRTLRRHSDLVRHQLLIALHETIGRPTFRPTALQILGIGVHWAFRGIEGFMTVVDDHGRVVDEIDPNWRVRLNQYCEFALICGPADEELLGLKALGYVAPRFFETIDGNRLAWEQSYVEQAEKTKSREVQRVALFARELTHEYGEILQTIFNEYHLALHSILNGSAADSRTQMMAFSERVPTMRIAVDIKLEMFRNPARQWTWNMLRDIDALSIAIPHCHVVIADRDALDMALRSDAPQHHGTVATSNLQDLPDLLTDLAATARHQGPDPSDWSSFGPGDGYAVTMPEPLSEVPIGAEVRLLDRTGSPLPSPVS